MPEGTMLQIRSSVGKQDNAKVFVQDLILIRQASRRRGTWYRSLSLTERRFIDLTIKLVKRVKSMILATAIHQILGKLSASFISRVESIGRPLAAKLARVAQKWGYSEAETWAKSRNYIQLLGLNALAPSFLANA